MEEFHRVARPLPFERTVKQQEASQLIAFNRFIMLFGGSRSGKTFILVYAIIVRALKCKSRHIIVRFRFNHVKRSIYHDTFPKVMQLCFPNVTYRVNKMDWFIEFPNGSEIWLGGIDDKQRTEQILGNEYSTIYANETSQISYDAITMLQTRMAEKTELVNKFFFDCNPPTTKHWSYLLFVQGKDPVDNTPIDIGGYASLKMNPKDNLENIAQGYIDDVLMRMPLRQRKRFLEGEFLLDVDGALWDSTMIDQAKCKDFAEIEETVIALDPSATGHAKSDLCGIVVCSRDSNKEGVVESDHSMIAKPGVWAQAAVNLYHEHNASCIVAEVNQGGDMVEAVIHNIDPTVKVVKVHAKRGKLARAEPISVLYEQGKVAHKEGLEFLEAEMMEYVPLTAKHSPDRMDAAVYGLTHLMLGKAAPEPTIRVA